MSIIHSSRCHPGGHDSTEHRDDDLQPSSQPILNDVRNLFLKYSNGSYTNRMSLDEFIGSFMVAHLSHMRPSNSSHSGAYSCYSSRLVDLSVRLGKLNQTGPHNNFIDNNRFAKVSAFLIANFDRCYGGQYSLLANHSKTNHHEKSVFETILNIMKHLNKEGFDSFISNLIFYFDKFVKCLS